MVETDTSPLLMVVLRAVDDTLEARAATVAPSPRSTRRKTIPVPAGAGFTVMCEYFPVCSPFPSKLCSEARVFCLIFEVIDNDAESFNKVCKDTN